MICSRRHAQPARGEPARRLDAEQPAADHHRGGAGGGVLHGLEVVEIAEGDDAGQAVAGNRQPHGLRSRRQHEAVVGETRAGRQHHLAPCRPQRRGLHATDELRARLPVPVAGPQLGVACRALAGQHARQQHAVVGQPRLPADQHDLELAGAQRAKLLGQLDGRHAGAEHHQPLAFARGAHRPTPPLAAPGLCDARRGTRARPTGRG